jgi:hypothetical protein
MNKIIAKVFSGADPDEGAYKWMCGLDPRIAHQRPIGSGGYADVHEVKLFLSIPTDRLDAKQENKRSAYSISWLLT